MQMQSRLHRHVRGSPVAYTYRGVESAVAYAGRVAFFGVSLSLLFSFPAYGSLRLNKQKRQPAIEQ